MHSSDVRVNVDELGLVCNLTFDSMETIHDHRGYDSLTTQKINRTRFTLNYYLGDDYTYAFLVRFCRPSKCLAYVACPHEKRKPKRPRKLN